MARLNVNVNDDTAQALREMADRNNTSATEMIRRAVGTYKYIEDGIRRGKELKLVDENEETTLTLLVKAG